jgi:hypothetical protein
MGQSPVCRTARQPSSSIQYVVQDLIQVIEKPESIIAIRTVPRKQQPRCQRAVLHSLLQDLRGVVYHDIGFGVNQICLVVGQMNVVINNPQNAGKLTGIAVQI